MGDRVGACAVLLVLAGLLSACQPAGRGAPGTAPGPRTTTASPGGVPTASPGGVPTALSLVASLPVQGRGARTGYTREQFGPAWADTDRNGCDTRDDILRRDLSDPAFRPGTRDCVVLSGHFIEPYTGREVVFRKETAGDVQIDHVVALSDAWQKGAAQWSPARRLAFANDPLELLAADGPANTAKGDGDTATWLPPNKAYRCEYVARQVAVKHAYGLSVTSAERDAMLRVLGACPAEPAPSGATTRLPSVPSAPAAAPPTASSPVPAAAATAAPAGVTDPDYGTCAVAKAHGAGPYRRGQTEYGWYRDADGDGVVCER